MDIITTKAAMQEKAKGLVKTGASIGFVPTMGFLHDGHLRLVKESVANNDITIMSIFVNPLQFGPGEDFEAYPRDVERDKKLAMEAGVDILFLPQRDDMYPRDLSIDVKAVSRTDVLCGKSRPGHFDGVATVLIKLFNITMPDNVYFGQKDAQQVAVVEALIQDLDIPVELVPVPTVREQDGLARSSRNVYLNEEERAQAPHLYKSLQLAETAMMNGEYNTTKLVEIIKNHINENTNGIIDYVEILKYPELQSINQIEGKIIIAIAVKFSRARLIDNMIINLEEMGGS
ncbi:pantoate--beta-alanine ligase [Lederbergia graminis]|uniref:Pantothenate synthetase n=1 Tax=Lederbergia graminis TaxID=735518 RepID=A0ABW0LC86_9BACI